MPEAVLGTGNTGVNFWKQSSWLPSHSRAPPLPLTATFLDPLLFTLGHSPLGEFLYVPSLSRACVMVALSFVSSELQAHVPDSLPGIFTCWSIGILK